ncbi:sulfate adenylyltransferase [Putridiphycobacter roseus]|uniref:sulfate adenylyltransferase n=1 Tax=Putridiphycobacter roseus TaxID=2219161 RepID=A0A2W1N498_9FLAO|nr:GTP-binding protein [Putridiphycobacter roseus]PZE17891.1 sulfate adenylyltransferase [Putridiphycobacter roseus]
MQVLKIATAGSVDDGKSTLIGRLLYDTKSLTDDKLEAIEKSSQKKGYDYLDFSMATDGLMAEREQGITIDVAHIYWATKNKSYIIADTPGHIEYTRNMVTGASTSQMAIILVDARHGVVEQTKRHFYINALLRIKDVVVAINKMDLVDYSEDKYEEIKAEILKISKSNAYQNQKLTFIPLSALKGDNVVDFSDKMPWYKGETLLSHLESIEVGAVFEKSQARFPVQTVIRPKSEKFHDYRGYAGKLYGGALAVGDKVTVLPSGTSSTIEKIQFYNQTYDIANAGDSIAISLTDDVNVSRGDMIVKYNELPNTSKTVEATICWMDQTPLDLTSKYILQHGVHQVLAKVTALKSLVKPDLSMEEKAIENLKINQIGQVSFKLNQAIYSDNYADNKQNGAFVLIDVKTNTTAGVGFIG